MVCCQARTVWAGALATAVIHSDSTVSKQRTALADFQTLGGYGQLIHQ